MTNINTRIGTNVCYYRKKRGLTQQTLADRVGITKQSICKIEKTGSANLNTLQRIANALFVDISDFYEPIEETATIPEIASFITVNEQEATIHEQIQPMMKRINDIVLSNYTKAIQKECKLTVNDITDFLKRGGYDLKRITVEDIYCICLNLNNEFIEKAISLTKQ